MPDFISFEILRPVRLELACVRMADLIATLLSSADNLEGECADDYEDIDLDNVDDDEVSACYPSG